MKKIKKEQQNYPLSLLRDYMPGPRLYGQGSSLAAPFGLALDRPRPWQKRKLKGGREKEIFPFSFWPQKENSAEASEVKA
ncbi:MAG: hypothetical protein LWW94_02975, partial [Candidatus Desulfofervidaceae bacterium]|nr:hypothetical protein [Candidatus Desulfofervidaceae bacterium]